MDNWYDNWLAWHTTTQIIGFFFALMLFSFFLYWGLEAWGKARDRNVGKASFCNRCGQEIPIASTFCDNCGAHTEKVMRQITKKKLVFKESEDKDKSVIVLPLSSETLVLAMLAIIVYLCLRVISHVFW